MLIAYELKRPLSEVFQYDREEVGLWLAFLKLKSKREEEAARKARNKQKSS